MRANSGDAPVPKTIVAVGPFLPNQRLSGYAATVRYRTKLTAQKFANLLLLDHIAVF